MARSSQQIRSWPPSDWEIWWPAHCVNCHDFAEALRCRRCRRRFEASMSPLISTTFHASIAWNIQWKLLKYATRWQNICPASIANAWQLKPQLFGNLANIPGSSKSIWKSAWNQQLLMMRRDASDHGWSLSICLRNWEVDGGGSRTW